MAKFDFSAQSILHSLEQGGLASIFRALAAVALVLLLMVLYLFVDFRGLREPEAMDMAQIGRQIAEGKGFSTNYIRPLALWQMESGEKNLPKGPFPDFSNAPLWPATLSLPFSVFPANLKLRPEDLIPGGDRMTAFVGMLFFLASAALWYFITKRVFDSYLAGFVLAVLLVTDLMWKFACSGLPQMQVLFFFSLAILFTVKAHGLEEIEFRPAMLWLGLAGLCMGLMTLSHGLAVFLFFGWLVYVFSQFRSVWAAPTLALLAFSIVVAPWLWRNYSVCGNAFGTTLTAFLFPSLEPHTAILRSLSPDFQNIGRGLKVMFRDGVLSQLSGLFGLLGLNVVAAAFFPSILHPFRGRIASSLRWGACSIWLAAIIGMALFGINSNPIAANQLHVVLLPLFAMLGAAFLYVLYHRWEFGSPALLKVFSGLLLFLVLIPMLVTFFLTRGPRVQWPPYVPPFIAAMGEWFDENEILASDMPWAVAWYANRTTILLPDSPQTLMRIHDHRVLGRPVAGVYLTPLTGNQPLVGNIYKGAYAQWARLILRPPDVNAFFLKKFVALPVEGECILFADTERWLRPRLSQSP